MPERQAAYTNEELKATIDLFTTGLNLIKYKLEEGKIDSAKNIISALLYESERVKKDAKSHRPDCLIIDDPTDSVKGLLCQAREILLTTGESSGYAYAHMSGELIAYTTDGHKAALIRGLIIP